MRSLVLLSAIGCLSMAGCLQVTASCNCNGGTPNTVSGVACGEVSEPSQIQDLFADAVVDAGTQCFANGGLLDLLSCQYDVVPVPSCQSNSNQ